MEFTIKDLFEKYGEEKGQELYIQHLKKHGKNKKMLRFIGMKERDDFLEKYQGLDDVEKLKYFDFRWHSIPMDKEFPSSSWQWVFDVWCWTLEGGD